MVYLVYKTDSLHSYVSRDLIAVATDETMAIDLCQQQAKKEYSKINKEQLFNLQSIRQTQGYKGGGEFQIEAADLDVLY